MPQARTLNKIVLASLFAFILQGCDSSTSDSIAKPVIDKKMTKEEQRQALIDSIENPAEASTMLLVNGIIEGGNYTSSSKELLHYKSCVQKNLVDIGWTAEEHVNFYEVFGISPTAQAMHRKVGNAEYQKRYNPVSLAARPCVRLIYNP